MGKLQEVKKSVGERLTKEQKEKVKQVVPFLGLPIAKVEVTKHKLHNLGFVERALSDLQYMYQSTRRKNLKKYVAFELALWHMNQYTKEDAQKALDYLGVYIESEEREEKIRRATILAVEAMNRLEVHSNAQHTADLLLKKAPHPDLHLARANAEKDMNEKIFWINKVLKNKKLLKIELKEEKLQGNTPYDALGTVMKKELVNNPEMLENKVTVLMPVYKAKDQFRTALDSVLAQTWTNLEVLVIDDYSRDGTLKMMRDYAKKDARVKVLAAPRNGGPYVARNIALKEATGKFITINDADDWSHPEKIETQVKHLLKHNKVMGNMSEQARMFDDLTFYRRGRPGEYIFKNMSSFLFRREEVLEKLGNWDSVRFAGDSEFIFRVKKVFGETSVAELRTGPLSFQRHSESSLTGNEAFGLPNYKMGARREYELAHDHFHNKATDLYYPFPQEERPFAIPEPMRPERETKSDGSRTFDVVYAADFRLEEALTPELLQEIRENKGSSIGFIQLHRYEASPFLETHSKYRKMINEGTAEMLVYGEKIRAKKAVFADPRSLSEEQRYVPNLEADTAVIVSRNTEDLQTAVLEKHAKHYAGTEAGWV